MSAQAGNETAPSAAVAGSAARPILVDDAAMPFADTSSRAFRTGLVVVVLSLVSALSTYLILTNLTPITPRGEVVFVVLFLNVVMILAVIAVVAYQGAALYRAWREKVAGARLHIRIVALFSLITILPALILAIAATSTFARAIDGWFAERTRQIIQTSLDVARAYIEEHGQTIRNDAENMASDLVGQVALLNDNPEAFKTQVFIQAGLRELPVARIVDSSGRTVLNAAGVMEDAQRRVPANVIALARAGQVPVSEPDKNFRVAALTRLGDDTGLYLYVARGVSPKVLSQLRRTEAGVAEYTQLRKRRSGLQIAHGLLYFMISLTGLLAAIWAGLWFAGKFVAPIGRLIAAAQYVSQGHLDVILPERRGEGDLRRLSKTFNTMTAELKSQQTELVNANQQLMEDRRFIEAVMSGVTAGVIGVDSNGLIRLVNPSAQALLARSADDLIGEKFDAALPEIAGHLKAISADPGLARKQPPLTIPIDGEDRTFNVRLTNEATGADRGTVVTLDDITELERAQRASAWSGVARYLAHEIKNPLQPIQLSADRIQRRFGKYVTADREIFDNCTGTIVRQVEVVRNLVDEFSKFAKLPAPKFQMADVRKVVREAAMAYDVTLDTVKVTTQVPDAPIMTALDPDLMNQVVTNIVKNATEAISAAAPDRGDDYRGLITVAASSDGDTAQIVVTDNGTGLDKQNRKRLLEVGVSTKAKSRGLGLAIVNQIIEAHGGTIRLEDAPVTPDRPRGAQVTVTLPMRTVDQAAANVTRLAAAE